MKIDLKNLGIYLTVGTLIIGTISGGAIAKKNIEDSKAKISELEKAQIQYAVQQGKVETKLEGLEQTNQEIKQDIKENQKILLEELKKRR